jgi:hypothetical protein
MFPARTRSNPHDKPNSKLQSNDYTAYPYTIHQY